jgi:hypothetical protein
MPSTGSVPSGITRGAISNGCASGPWNMSVLHGNACADGAAAAIIAHAEIIEIVTPRPARPNMLRDILSLRLI